MKKLKLFLGEIKKRFIYKTVFALCVGLIYCLFAYQSSLGMATAYLELNYPQALKGQYLNGTRLNMYDILSQDILENAIDKAGLAGKLTTRGLSGMLTISPRHSSTPTNEYIATEFEVDISMDEPINNVNSQGLLQMVCMAFIETFYDAHAYNQTVLSFSLDDLDKMDYDEIGIMLQTKADLISDYIDYRCDSAADFLSDDTGESFSSLKQKISDFSDIVMENYNAYVLNNGVTRDIEKLRSTLDYEQILLKKSYDVSLAGYDARIKAIGEYDPVQSAIVMIPTVDETGEFYMSKTKIGVDYLAQQANESMGRAMTTKKTIDRNDARLDLANFTAESARDMAADKLDFMIEDILSSLGDLEQLVIKTDDEYIRQQTAESLTYRIRYASAMERYSVKKTALCVAVVFALLTALFWTWDKRGQQREKRAGEQNA